MHFLGEIEAARRSVVRGCLPTPGSKVLHFQIGIKCAHSFHELASADKNLLGRLRKAPAPFSPLKYHSKCGL